MVRLKGTLRLESNAPILKFQFQNGAIKVAAERRKDKPYNTFQFQNGAIKSFCVIGFIMLPLSFNSKMVRLKAKLKRENGRYIIVSIPKWCD